MAQIEDIAQITTAPAASVGPTPCVTQTAGNDTVLDNETTAGATLCDTQALPPCHRDRDGERLHASHHPKGRHDQVVVHAIKRQVSQESQTERLFAFLQRTRTGYELNQEQSALLATLCRALFDGKLDLVHHLIKAHEGEPESLTPLMDVLVDDLTAANVPADWHIDQTGSQKVGYLHVYPGCSLLSFSTAQLHGPLAATTLILPIPAVGGPLVYRQGSVPCEPGAVAHELRRIVTLQLMEKTTQAGHAQKLKTAAS